MLDRLTALFLALLNMSVTASWAILAVFAARLLLQKAPGRVTYWLWATVHLLFGGHSYDFVVPPARESAIIGKNSDAEGEFHEVTGNSAGCL